MTLAPGVSSSSDAARDAKMLVICSTTKYIGGHSDVIGGAVAFPIGTALKTVGAVFSLAPATKNALTKKPQAPKERAVAYAAAANKKWFNGRGLHAQLLDSVELAAAVGADVNLFADMGKGGNKSAESGLERLMGTYVADLEIKQTVPLDVGVKSMWLVVSVLPPKA